MQRVFCATVSDLVLLRIGEHGIDVHREFAPGEAWAEHQRQMTDLQTLVASAGTSDVELVIACEGGDFLEADPGRVEQAYAAGVRSIQLVHYAPNLLADNQTLTPVFGGLSGLGREVVAEMNRVGMLIDVAHASTAAVEQVAMVKQAHPLCCRIVNCSVPGNHTRGCSVTPMRELWQMRMV